MNQPENPRIRRLVQNPENIDQLRWEGIDLKKYDPNQEKSPNCFKDITRQVFFGAAEGLPCELRYFEMGRGGHSTLERHHHIHGVLILQGRGRVLLGDTIHPVAPFDVIYIPPLTWHQFRADEESSLGFLCLVKSDRDRPMLPTSEDLDLLRQNPQIAEFIRV